MELCSLMLYNSSIKFAGNVVTLKTYSEDQAYGYAMRKGSKEYTLDQVIKEWWYQMGLGLSSGEVKEYINIKLKWLQLKYNSDQAKKERFIKSCRRAKSKIFDLVACNVDKHLDHEGKKQMTKFLTLTFSENMKDLAAANYEVTKFLKRISNQYYDINKNVIKYVCVPELQKRGAWHYHIILFNAKFLHYHNYNGKKFTIKKSETIENYSEFKIEKTNYKEEIEIEKSKTIENYSEFKIVDKRKKGLLNLWGLGGVYINAIKKGIDATTTAKYVTKYISKGINIDDTKDIGEYNINHEEGAEDGDKRLSDYDNYILHNMQKKKRYQCSKGLFKPLERKLKITRSQWSFFYNYLIHYAKVDHDNKKLVYAASYDNEYRGEINSLVVEIDKRCLRGLKTIVEDLYQVNRKRYKATYKTDWKEIHNKIYDEQERRGSIVDLCPAAKRVIEIKQSIIHYQKYIHEVA